MRITNSMIVDDFMVNMQANLTSMNQYANQLATNRKIVNLSDDPVGVYNALTARQRLADYERYEDSLTTARAWVEQSDAALQEVSAKIADVKEALIQAASDVMNDGDRNNIAVLAGELRDTITDALNVNIGGQYVFGGFNQTNPPFSIDDSGKVLYNDIDLSHPDVLDDTTAMYAEVKDEEGQVFTIEVGYGVHMEVTMPGIEVVGKGDENLFKICEDVISLMENNPGDVVEQLSNLLDDLSNAHLNVTSGLVKVGATSFEIDTLESRYSADIINYNDIRSRVEDIDAAETIMQFEMAEAVYKQSLAVGARIIMPTLLDYLQ